jgi:hypothetical protein
MNALIDPMISLQGGRLTLYLIPECRFCGCTEEVCCKICACEESDGIWHLVQDAAAEATFVLECDWFLPGICNAPACIEKLQQEFAQQSGEEFDQRTG